MTKYYAVGLPNETQDAIRVAFNDYLGDALTHQPLERVIPFASPYTEAYMSKIPVTLFEDIFLSVRIFRLAEDFLFDAGQFIMFTKFLKQAHLNGDNSNYEQTHRAGFDRLKEACLRVNNKNLILKFIAILTLEHDTRFEIDEDLVVSVNVNNLSIHDLIEHSDTPVLYPLYGPSRTILDYFIRELDKMDPGSEEYIQCLMLLASAIEEELLIHAKGTACCDLNTTYPFIFLRLLQMKQTVYVEEILPLLKNSPAFKNTSQYYILNTKFIDTVFAQNAAPLRQLAATSHLREMDDNVDADTLQHQLMRYGRIDYDEKGQPTFLRAKNKKGELPHQVAFQNCLGLTNKAGNLQGVLVSSSDGAKPIVLPDLLQPVTSIAGLRLMMQAFKKHFSSIEKAESTRDWGFEAQLVMCHWLYGGMDDQISPFNRIQRLKLIFDILNYDDWPPFVPLMRQALSSMAGKVGLTTASLNELAQEIFACDAMLTKQQFLRLLDAVKFEPEFKWVQFIQLKLPMIHNLKYFDALCKALLLSARFRAALCQVLNLKDVKSFRLIESGVARLGEKVDLSEIKIDIPSLLNFALTYKETAKQNTELMQLNVLIWNDQAVKEVSSGKSPELLRFCLQYADLSQEAVRKVLIEGLKNYTSAIPSVADFDPALLAKLKERASQSVSLFSEYTAESTDKGYIQLARFKYLGLIPEKGEAIEQLPNFLAWITKEDKLSDQPHFPDLQTFITDLVVAYESDTHAMKCGELYWLFVDTFVNHIDTLYLSNLMQATHCGLYREYIRIALLLLKRSYMNQHLDVQNFTRNSQAVEFWGHCFSGPLQRSGEKNVLQDYLQLEYACNELMREILQANPTSQAILVDFLLSCLELRSIGNIEAFMQKVNLFQMDADIKLKHPLTKIFYGLKDIQQSNFEIILTLLKARVQLFPEEYVFAKEILAFNAKPPAVQAERRAELIYNLKC